MLKLSKSVYYYQSNKNDEPVENALQQKAEQNQGKDSGKLIKGCATKASNGITDLKSRFYREVQRVHRVYMENTGKLTRGLQK